MEDKKILIKELNDKKATEIKLIFPLPYTSIFRRNSDIWDGMCVFDNIRIIKSKYFQNHNCSENRNYFKNILSFFRAFR